MVLCVEIFKTEYKYQLNLYQATQAIGEVTIMEIG